MRRLLVAASLLLAGCQAPPVYGPSPEPPVEPFFDSEEAAFEAVDAFMGEYTAAVSELLRTDGGNQDALAVLASDQQLADELAILDKLHERQLTFVGDYTYFGLEIQQFHQDTATSASVQAYVCMDYRTSYYVGPDGAKFEGEADWTPFEAILTATGEKSLVMEELRRWTGRDFCEGSS